LAVSKTLHSFQLGARVPGVEEPRSASQLNLIQPEILFLVEFGEVAEPKGLSSSNLRDLIQRHGSAQIVANTIGVSEAFVRQNSGPNAASTINKL
jgi:hypothetical protein